MLKRYFGLVVLCALALCVGGVAWLHRLPSAPRGATPVAVLAMPVVPAPAPAPAPVAAPVIPAPPPPAAAKEPDLPTVEVGQLAVHTIDDTAALPIPTVTLHQKDGRVASLTPVPPPAPTKAAIPLASGSVVATGSAAFGVAGLPMHLFGVRPPEPRDRCGSGRSASCGDGARAALAARLGKAGNVKCTIPAGQLGDPGFVCHDGAGVDLGGLLVAQGLALADTSSSYNYVGAQNTARSSRRGLWAFR